MARINLLPWRESLRQEQKQQYIVYLVIVAIITFAFVWVIAEFIDSKIRYQQSRNLFMTQQIEVLDQQIEEIKELQKKIDEITIRMSLIEQLQISRNLTTMLLDEIARAVPTGISLNSISRQGDLVTIVGVTNSNNRLSSFMRAIEASKVFAQPELSSIVADLSANNAVSDFELSVSIVSSLTTDAIQSASE